MSCCCSRSSGRKLAEPKKRRRKRRRRPPKRGSSGKEKIDPRSPTKSCLDVYRRRRDEGERNEGRLWEKRTKREERREKRRESEGDWPRCRSGFRVTACFPFFHSRFSSSLFFLFLFFSPSINDRPLCIVVYVTCMCVPYALLIPFSPSSSSFSICVVWHTTCRSSSWIYRLSIA